MLSTDSEKFPYIHSRSGRTSHRPKIAQLTAISEGTTTAVRSMSGDGGCGGCGDCWAARPNEVRTRADGTALRIRGRPRDIMSPSLSPGGRARARFRSCKCLPDVCVALRGLAGGFTRAKLTHISHLRTAPPLGQPPRRQCVSRRCQTPAHGTVGHAAAAAGSG